MNNTIIKILLFCLTFLIVIFPACSPSGQKETSENQVNEVEQKIEPVIVITTYKQKATLGNYERYVSIVFTDENGEYLRFDNDADYQELAKKTFLIKKITHRWLLHYIAHSLPDSISLRSNNEKNLVAYGYVWSDKCKSVLRNMPKYIEAYYNGDKGLIPADVFQVIDKFNYDTHPENLAFEISESYYNIKQYNSYNSTGSTGFVCFEPTKDSNDKFITINGDTIPPGIVICDDYLDY